MCHKKNTNVHNTKAQSNDIIPLSATVPSLKNLPPTENKIIVDGASDFYCRSTFSQICHPKSDFHTDHCGFLIRKSTVSIVVQILVHDALRQCISHLENHLLIAGQSNKRIMNNMLWGKLSWQYTAKDVYETVAKCVSSAKNGSKFKHKTHLHFFPAAEPPDFVFMNILGPLRKATQGKQIVFVITDRYFKLARAIPTSETSSAHIANVFLKHWIVPFGIPKYLLAENKLQPVSTFFASICAYLGVKESTTTVHRPQINGHSKRYNHATLTRHRHYISWHQRNLLQYATSLV